jgi:hypothetical protein
MWIARISSAQVQVSSLLSMTNEQMVSEQLDVGREFLIELRGSKESAVVMARAVEDLIFKLATDKSKWRMRRATAEEVEILVSSPSDASAQHWIVTSVA